MSEKTILHSETYFDRCKEILESGKTLAEAWEMVETELSAQFRMRRFVSIESFRDGYRKQRQRKRSRKPQKVILVEEC